VADAALELLNCSYHYPGGVRALEGVTCLVERGSWTALVGQNGSGKSTLAKLCNGLLRPQEGQVRVMGDPVGDRSVGDMARHVGYLFQNPDHQLFASTVRDEIKFGLRNLGFAPADREERLREALTAFGLDAYVDHPPAVLGFGLRRQVTLASLFALRPPVLILDEPTTGLDWGRATLVLERLRALQLRGHTIVFITHQMALVADWADRVLVLHRGQLLADGHPGSIFARTDVMEQASLAPPPITELAQRLSHIGLPSDATNVDALLRSYIALLPQAEEEAS